MKLLKKSLLLSLVAPLLFSLLSFKSMSGDGKIVTIRIFEVGKNFIGIAKIQITEEGKSRVIDLEKFDPKNPELSKNMETVSNLFEQYYKEGYKIETSNTLQLSHGQATLVTTYILTK